MLAPFVLALVPAQTTVDDPFVWNFLDAPNVPPGSFVQELGTTDRDELFVRVADTLHRVSPDGISVFSANVAGIGLDSVAVLGSGGYATAAVIDETDPSFPAASGAAGDDIGVIRYDAQGVELWRQRIGGPLDEERALLLTDRLGGLYAVVEHLDPTLGPPFAPDVRQLTITRLDSAGTPLWSALQEVGLPDDSARFTGAAAHPVHGLVLASEEEGPVSAYPESYLSRYLPDGQRAYWVPAQPHSARLLIDDTGAVHGAYRFFDVASSVAFSGLVSYDAGGSQRWARGHCGATVGTIDEQGLLWALSEEVLAGNPCTFFETPEVRRLLRIDPANGQVVERIDVPTPVAASPFARLTMSEGGHLVVRGATVAEAFLARLSRSLGVAMGTCPGQPNSTGVPGELLATGNESRSRGDLTIFAHGLPAAATTLFIAGFAGGFVAGPGGSQGDLCLSGPIGRFTEAGQLRAASPRGRVALKLDLDRIPTPSSFVPMTAGQTVHFQAWYRDATPLPTSNFTSAVAVTLN